MEERRRGMRRVVRERIEYDADPTVLPLRDELPPAPIEVDPAAEARIIELRERTMRQAEANQAVLERRRALTPLFRFVDFVFFLIYAVLGIRLVLTLLAARPEAPFAQFIFRVSEPLYAPFRGLLPNLTTEAGFTVALPLIFAMLVYGLVHAGIRKLLSVFAGPRVL